MDSQLQKGSRLLLSTWLDDRAQQVRPWIAPALDWNPARTGLILADDAVRMLRLHRYLRGCVSYTGLRRVRLMLVVFGLVVLVVSIIIDPRATSGLSIALSTVALVSVVVAALLRQRDVRGLLAALEGAIDRCEPRCLSCEYSLAGLEPEQDGCTVCPECGGAWELPDTQAQSPPRNV